MTLFNYWHYIAVLIILVVFVLAIRQILNSPNKKLVKPMIFSVVLVTSLATFLAITVIDKYTKKVGVYKLKNKRLLSTEQIIYTGLVKNEGNHEIGKVYLEIKLVNKGHVTGTVKGTSFYETSDFWDFLGGMNKVKKPQSIKKEFVVAKNLEPGQVKSFRVYFRYPSHFRSVSQFTEAFGR